MENLVEKGVVEEGEAGYTCERGSVFPLLSEPGYFIRRVLLSVRPRDEQEEADEHNRDTTQRGALSAIGGVGAGVCGPLAQSQ